MDRYDVESFNTDLHNLAEMQRAMYLAQQRVIVHAQRILFKGYTTPTFECADREILANTIEVAA